MPVKSTLVPDALTAVPEISNVPFSLALLPTAAKAVAVMISPYAQVPTLIFAPDAPIG
jgi:hypothetical protein